MLHKRRKPASVRDATPATSRRLAPLWTLVALVVLLAGCTLATSAGLPVEPGTLQADLATHLAETYNAQTQALGLWDRLIFGEQVSCQEAITVPELVTLSRRELEAHPQAEEIQQLLNAAIRQVHQSAKLWDDECAQERERVPLNVAREGRAAGLAATESLQRVAQLLAAW